MSNCPSWVSPPTLPSARTICKYSTMYVGKTLTQSQYNKTPCLQSSPIHAKVINLKNTVNIKMCILIRLCVSAICLVAKCLAGEMSGLSAKCQAAKNPSAKCLSVKFPSTPETGLTGCRTRSILSPNLTDTHAVTNIMKIFI